MRSKLEKRLRQWNAVVASVGHIWATFNGENVYLGRLVIRSNMMLMRVCLSRKGCMETVSIE